MVADKKLKTKKAVKKIKEDVPVILAKEPSSKDIKIDILVTMQDGSVHEKYLSIVNPGGCILKSQLNSSDKVFEMIKLGLIHIYGANHIKE